MIHQANRNLKKLKISLFIFSILLGTSLAGCQSPVEPNSNLPVGDTEVAVEVGLVEQVVEQTIEPTQVTLTRIPNPTVEPATPLEITEEVPPATAKPDVTTPPTPEKITTENKEKNKPHLVMFWSAY